MRYQTFNEIPNEAALNLCWTRAGAARRKWEEEGAASLTAEDIHDITLVGDPAEARTIREQAQKARDRAAQAQRQRAVQIAPPRQKRLVVPEGCDTVEAILAHPMNRDVVVRAGELAVVLKGLGEHLKANLTKNVWRNQRLSEIEARVGALDGQRAKAAVELKDLSFDDAIALEARSPARSRLRARHRGTWQAKGEYKGGDAVIHAGRLWVAKGSFAIGEPGMTAYWVEAAGRED